MLRDRITQMFLMIALALWAPAAVAFHEAPMLAERVAKGELPPVEKRLPEEPAVVEPVERVGDYGGSWRCVTLGIYDIHLNMRMGYEPLVRWARDAKTVVPGLAKSWDVLDGGCAYAFHLRRGLKWSDGEPVTSEDFRFTWEDFILNTAILPIPPPWLMIDGEPARIETPDDLTVIYRFKRPYALFPEAIAFEGNTLLQPKHYMSQFHEKYAEPKALEAKVRARGMERWSQLYAVQANPDLNPELPTCKPFVLKVGPPATRMIAERNPYYWKVDTAGNQLPYLDRIVYTDVQNTEIATIKALAGDVDFQSRRIDPANYPLFMENRKKGGYQVRHDPTPDPNVVYINQYSKDPELRPILQDKRFRIALSVAINREEVIQLLFSGLATPSRGVACPFDPYYLPEFDRKYIEYDPALANRLLDEVGLRRGPDGMRRMPNGKPFRQILNVYQSETGSTMNLWQLVADYWREVGLDFVLRMDAPTLSRMQILNGNTDFWAYVIDGIHWVLSPFWYVPWNSASYFAPLYGTYHETKGKRGVPPPPELQRLVDTYTELQSCTDEARRLELGQNILRQWAEECYVIGVCRNDSVAIVKNDFRNVPEQIVQSYHLMTPGYLGIEQFFLEHGGAGR